MFYNLWFFRFEVDHDQIAGVKPAHKQILLQGTDTSHGAHLNPVDNSEFIPDD